MKTLIIVGSHPRNLGLLEKLSKNKDIQILGVILFLREKLIPEPDINMSQDLKKLWYRHFKKRKKIEDIYFDKNKNIYKKFENRLEIRNVEEFNSDKVIKFVKRLKADSCFVSGAPLIKKNLLKALPKYTINLHLGLIPHYKGTITVFWPFYFLEPTMVGTTYHIIDQFVDTGEIIHQNVPKLRLGDSMHETSCKAINAGLADLNKVVSFTKKRIQKNIKSKKDKTLRVKGKLFKNSDWRPEMLRVIYDYFNDKIVDLYLTNKIKCKKPKLIKLNKSFNKN